MEGQMRKMYEMMIKMAKGRINVQVCTSIICVSTAMCSTNLRMKVHCRVRLRMMVSVW